MRKLTAVVLAICLAYSASGLTLQKLASKKEKARVLEEVREDFPPVTRQEAGVGDSCESDGRTGKCMHKLDCETDATFEWVSSKCPAGGSNIKCCLKLPEGSRGRTYWATIVTPTDEQRAGFNKMTDGTVLHSATTGGTNSLVYQKFGNPGCPLTAECLGCSCAANEKITSYLTSCKLTEHVTVRLTRFFCTAMQAAMEEVKTAEPEVYRLLRTEGGFCCRAIKHTDGTLGTTHSNHAFGCAVDFRIGDSARRPIERAMLQIQHILADHKIYWGGAWTGSSQDGMHFESSKELVNEANIP